jgi:NitT/TauT family transport system substrate-binding protein
MRRIIFTLALLAAFMPAARAKDLTKVTLVQSSQSMNFVPIYIAQTEGYFKEEGLDVTVVLAGGGPKAMTALIGGGGQFSASVLLDGIMAHRRGLTDVKALATLSYFLAPMAVRADVAKQHGITLATPLKQRVEAMKGLKMGITTPGASSDLVLRYLLVSQGLRPDRFLDIVPVGGVSTTMAALEAKSIDGCSCVPPVDVMANLQGLTVSVIDQAKDMPELTGVTYGTLYGLASYNKAHPEVAAAMARAITRATVLIGRNPEAAKQATRPFFKQTDEATWNASWSTYSPNFPKDPEISQHGFEQELAFEKTTLPAKDATSVPYQEVVDTEFLRAARQELLH